MKALVWAYEDYSNRTYVVLFEDRSGIIVAENIADKTVRIRGVENDLLDSPVSIWVNPPDFRDHSSIIIPPFVVADARAVMLASARLDRPKAILTMIRQFAARHEGGTGR